MIKKIISSLTLLILLSSSILEASAANFYKQQVQVNGSTYSVYMIEVGQNDKVNVIGAGNEDKIGGTASINSMTSWAKGKGGINGGFFKMDTHLPLGIIYKSDQLYTGTLYDRSALIGYKNNTYEIRRLHFEGLIKRNWDNWKVDSYNQPRLSKQQVIVYDQKWTYFVSSIFKGGKLLIVKKGKIIAETEKGAKVPKDGYIIYGPESKLEGLKVGDSVDFSYKISDLDLSKVKFILSGGPRLLEDKNIINNISEERFSCNSVCYNARRTAVAIKDGKLYFIATAQGVSLNTFSKILQAAGFDNAINFDGGGSTQMSWGGKVIIGGRLVNNGLIVY